VKNRYGGVRIKTAELPGPSPHPFKNSFDSRGTTYRMASLNTSEYERNALLAELEEMLSQTTSSSGKLSQVIASYFVLFFLSNI
jgi:hypothetical protein